MNWRKTLPILAVVAAIVLLAVLYYRATALTNLIPVGYDTFTYFYPNETYAASALNEGRLPLWNPYIFAGVPFLANSQTAIFYPANLLFLLTSIPRAYADSVLLHVILLGCTTYAFGRLTLRVGRPAALVATTIMMFGGFTGSMYGHLNQLQVAAWAPLVLLLFERAYRRQSLGWTALTSLVIAMQALAGHTQELYLTLAMLGFFFVLLLANSLIGHYFTPSRTSVGPDSESREAAEIRRASTGHVILRESHRDDRRIHPAHRWGGFFVASLLRMTGEMRPFSSARESNRRSGNHSAAHALSFVARQPSIAPYLLRQAALFAVTIGLGFALAAVQLMPTVELSSLSIRSGGMTLDEAASFSLPPWMLLKSLLPLYGEGTIFSEWLGYVGIVGLLLAALALVQRPRHRYVIFFTLLALFSLIMALGEATPFYALAYKLVPGTNLFRVPARWLYPYTLSIAALAALGLHFLRQSETGQLKRLVGQLLAFIIAIAILFTLYALLRLQPPLELPGLAVGLGWCAGTVCFLGLLILGWRAGKQRLATGGIVAILIGELFLSGLPLELNRPNLPEAFSAIRTSTSQLLTDKSLYRTLAAADNTYDPGDMAQLKAQAEPLLSPEQVYDYIVAAKLKETLAPNMPMVYQIPSFDGYDGGVLPLTNYVEFKSLFPASGGSAPDARFREHMNIVPPTKLLSWLNVKYVLMDRVHDVWRDNVYYDLGVSTPLPAKQSMTLNNFDPIVATSLGVASFLTDCAALPQGSEVATISVTDTEGHTYQTTLRTGVDTAESHYEEAQQTGIAHQQAPVLGNAKGDPEGIIYLTKLTLPTMTDVQAITVQASDIAGEFHLRGLSLINDQLNTSQTVVVNNALRMAYLGDVKIYENTEVAPRAFLVNRITLAATDDEALELMQAESFNGQREAVALVQEWQDAYGRDGATPPATNQSESASLGQVEIVSYEAERVKLAISARERALLVLTDSHYPGWRAAVDGQEQPILRTNHLFRGVLVEPGEHEVEFIFDPSSVKTGAAVSALALLVIIGLLAFSIWRHRRLAG